MNVLVDVLILAIMILCVWIGKERGFIKSFFGFFGSVVAFFLTALLATPVGTFLSENMLYPLLKDRFLASLSSQMGEAVSTIDFSALPEVCHDLLSRFGTGTDEIAQHFSALSESVGEAAVESVSQFVVRPVADAVGYAVAFLVLFVVFSLVIRILVKVLDLVSKLPFLNFSNRFLGILAGALQGLLLVLVVSAVLNYAAPAIRGSENAFFAGFHPGETHLLKFFSSFDIFGVFFE